MLSKYLDGIARWRAVAIHRLYPAGEYYHHLIQNNRQCHEKQYKAQANK